MITYLVAKKYMTNVINSKTLVMCGIVVFI